MPEVFAIVLIGQITVGTVAGYIALAVVSYAINAALAPSPFRAPGATAARDLGSQTLSGVNPAAPWEIAYGVCRKGGNYVFRTIANGPGENVERHVIPSAAPYSIAVAAAAVYQDTVSVAWSFSVTNSDEVSEEFWVDFARVPGAPGVGEYSVASGVYSFNAADAGRNVRIVYIAFNSAVKYLHSVIVFSASSIQSMDTIYLDDQPVEFDAAGRAIGSYHGYIEIRKHLGTPGEPADQYAMAHLPGTWTAAHTLEGHAYLYVIFLKAGEGAPWGTQGVPNVSVLGHWKNDIYDPRTGLRGWTDNAALCTADYLAHPQIGLNAPYGTHIDNDDLIAAANICDEAVTLAAGGTEKRYTINGVVSTAKLPRDTLPQLVGAMAGRCVYVAGRWRLHAGAYTAPVCTITETDMRGAAKYTTRLSRRHTFNAVKGTFVSPGNNWQVADFPPLISDQFALEDNNETIYKDVELPYTTSASMAQRLAKIDLLRARQQISAELPLKLTGYKAEPPDTVALTLAKPGWAGKVFELTELRLNLGSVTPGVDWIVRETVSTIYDWSTSEESPVDPSSNSNLNSPFVVRAPGLPQVTEEIYDAFSFGARVRAHVTWSASADAVSNAYVLQWKKIIDSLWQEQSGLSTLNYTILDVEADTYFFRVAAVNGLGVRSAWSMSRVTFVGLMAPPADVTEFSVTKIGGLASAVWAPAPDIDVRRGGSLIVRHTSKLILSTWEDGIIFEEFAGNAVSGTLPLVSGTYMAKWFDGMSYSNSVASAQVTEGMINGLTLLATSTQAAGFTGSKTNITVDGGLGGIRLTTVAGTGTYLFDATMDLTTVATRRLEADIVALSYALGTLFDDHTGLFDDGGDFDGLTNINECDATLYARTTDTDPAGSPVWTAWVPFFVADFTCRALQFKLVLDSTSDGHNILITTLTVHAKGP
jgi:hypothetical protein